MADQIGIFAPATIANVGPGFDILGFAVTDPGDTLVIRKNKKSILKIINESGIDLPCDPDKNVGTVAIRGFLDHIGSSQGFDVIFKKKIVPGSGLGSSAASSGGAVAGANILLNEPLSPRELIPFAMLGEKIASGSAHADNVAPLLLGGITLVRSCDPLDIIDIPVPEFLFCSIVHPEISIATEDSRRILKMNISLKDAVRQSGNVAGLVAGFFKSDYRIISDSLHDFIAEPIRSFLIPGFNRVKQESMLRGALGCSIAGSGPSIFALSNDRDIAISVAEAMKKIYSDLSISCGTYVTEINPGGIRQTD